MPQDEKKPMRWLETTSVRRAETEAGTSTANNIPSTQEDGSDNRASNLLYSPTAKTAFVPVKKATSPSLDGAFASTSKAAAALNNEGYFQNSCSGKKCLRCCVSCFCFVVHFVTIKVSFLCF